MTAPAREAAPTAVCGPPDVVPLNVTIDERPARSSADEPPTRLHSLSPSRAGDFMTCPLLFRFRVLDRLPESPGPAAARGTLVHRVLEQLFDLPASDRTIAEAVALLPAAWSELVEAEPELADLAPGGEELSAWIEDAGRFVARYFQLEDPTRLEPAARELYVETTLDTGLDSELVLRGYIDRLDERPDGALRIVDYKTGAAPGPGFEARALFQMRFYALVIWRLRGVVPQVLRLVYLGSGETVSYAPDASDLEATERKIRALWAAIDHAYEAGEWVSSPSRMCEWCSFRAICPEFGGTPPPLPALARIVEDTTSDVASAEHETPVSSTPSEGS